MVLLAASINLGDGKALTSFLMLSFYVLIIPTTIALLRSRKKPIKQVLRRAFLSSAILFAFCILVVWLLTRGFMSQDMDLVHEHEPSTVVLMILSGIGSFGLLVSSIMVIISSSKKRD